MASQLAPSGCPGCNSFYGARLEIIQKTSKDGCDFCSHICDAISKCLEPKALPEDTTCVWTPSSSRLYLQGTHNSGRRYYESLDLFVLPGKPSPASSLTVATFSPANTSSAESFAKVKSWLSYCTENHKRCRAGWGKEMPRRVIDVGCYSHSEQDPDIVWLREEPNCDSYICLSHRWGSSSNRHTYMTTKLSLSKHKEGIEFGQLPKTFQDAIIIARKLGVQFVWIDSLCIVQDDEEDWRTESAKMASTYTHSLLTIAATSSSGDYEGIFSPLPAKDVPHKLIMQRDGQSYDLYVCKSFRHPHYFTGWANYLDDTFPLLRRGWVYQERLLSRRVLHYTTNELFWECFETESCEYKESKGLCFTSLPELVPEKVGSWESIFGLGSNDSTRRQKLRRWHTIVRQFSGLELTFAKDKLPALSGAAAQLTAHRDDEFLAGMKRSELLEDMCWRVSTPRVKLSQFRAPSWSWASVDGLIEFDISGTENTAQAKLLEAECVVAGSNPFGEIKSGYVLISGHLLRAQVEYNPNPAEWEPEWGLFRIDTSGKRISKTFDADARMDYKHFPVSQIMDVVCLLLMETSSTLGNNDTWLILQKTGHEFYERIGICKERSFSRKVQWQGKDASWVGGEGTFTTVKII